MTSPLIDALNRILNWLEKNKPWYVEYLQPGLSLTEIEDIVKEIPRKLPWEIYELYQWRNGATEGDRVQETAWLFNNWTFHPLQDAVKQYSRYYSYSYHSRWPPCCSSLSIFYSWQKRKTGNMFFTQNDEYSPIIFFELESGGYGVEKKYTSLTSMMQTMAKCYETGAYYHDPQLSYSKSFISSCPIQERKIWREYNSELLDYAIEIIHSTFLLGELSPDLLASVSVELIEFGDVRVVDLLSHIIQAPIYFNDTDATNSFIKEEAIKILEKLGNTRAVPAIINCLKNDYFKYSSYLFKVSVIKALGKLKDARAIHPIVEATIDESEMEVRKTAAWALGEIGDPQAVEPLIEALADSEKQVRDAAREALNKLIAASPEIEDNIPF